MLEPGLVPRRAGAEQCPSRLADGQHACSSGHRPSRLNLTDDGADATRSFPVGEYGGPAEEIDEPERTGTPARRAEIVRADGDDRGLHLRRWIGQQGPLGEAKVGNSDRGE